MDSVAFRDVTNYPASENRWQVVDVNNPLPVQLRGSSGAAAPAGSNADPEYTKGAYSVLSDTIAQTANAVSTTLAATDCKDYQSVSLQVNVLSTYTGTLAYEVSNDGVNWVSKGFIRAVDGSLQNSASTTALAPQAWLYVSGDIGGRYVRVRQVTWTAGQVQVISTLSALSTATIPQQATSLLSGNNFIGGVVSSNHSSDTANSTSLAASATYTGATVDQSGNIPFLTSTRVRGQVAHTAGLTPGHVQLQESTDGTTFFETARMPIPSDGARHQFEFAVSLRYYRVNFINGATAQTLFFIQHHRITGEGESPVGRQNLMFPLSTTVLGVSGSYVSPTLDLGPTHKWERVRAFAASDQAGNLYCQQSKDGATWHSVRASDAGLGATVTADTVAITAAAGQSAAAEFKIHARYVRFGVVNGATAQTSFDLNCALVSL